MNQKNHRKIDPSASPLQARDHARILSISDEGQYLNSLQLERLERSFREWAEASPRSDVRLSRRRILLIFLLIRYAGAKLNEVLALNLSKDIDPTRHIVSFRGSESTHRELFISETLSREIASAIGDPLLEDLGASGFRIDPGFVRRKFYERARACGFPQRLGGPEMIRKARAVELMEGNLPLTAVQWMLGHSTPNLTLSYVSFSAEEIQQVAKLFMQRESSRKTSARNAFYAKVLKILRGDIQALLELGTLGGYLLKAVITNDSLERLGLREGRLITAEVKAPWVILSRENADLRCSAENRFSGIVRRIKKGRINTECVLLIPDGTELCALTTTTAFSRLGLRQGDPAWAFFNAFAVVLHVD